MAFTPQTTTYSLDRVVCILGPIILDGFSEGDAITVTRASPSFTKTVGADGKVCRSKTLDKSGSFAISLGQWSAANDQLSVLLNGDETAPNGAGITFCKLIDLSGRSLYFGKDSWLQGFPEAAFNREPGARVWTVDISKLDVFVGGN